MAFVILGSFPLDPNFTLFSTIGYVVLGTWLDRLKIEELQNDISVYSQFIYNLLLFYYVKIYRIKLQGPPFIKLIVNKGYKEIDNSTVQ